MVKTSRIGALDGYPGVSKTTVQEVLDEMVGAVCRKYPVKHVSSPDRETGTD